MEGLNDGRAVKSIVPQVNPRKMVNFIHLLFILRLTDFQIVVGASSTSAESLVTSCASIRSMTKDIMTPKVGESVQIGQQISSYPISIGDELLASIRMSKVGFASFLFNSGCAQDYQVRR
jgi:cleavage and polyadenylation specificity factor subunit 2